MEWERRAVPSQVDGFHSAIRDHVDDADVRVILDVGSRDALESLEFHRIYPAAEIYAFECHPACVRLAMENARGCPKIHVVPVAVQNWNGVVDFHPIDTRFSANVGASSLFTASGAYDEVEQYRQFVIQVEGTRLDTWARRNSVDRFDLVWMDLQGAELLALNGMGRLLSTVKAIHIEVEYREIYTGQVLFPEIDRYLKEAGLELLQKTDAVTGWFADAIYLRRNCRVGRVG
jgi:FkbM family methyltransferase